MSKPGILLTEAHCGWIVRGLSMSGPSLTIASMEQRQDGGDIADQLNAFAKKNGLDIGQIVIAVQSESVLFATVPSGLAGEIKTNQALRFALESVLPIDAEGIVADSVKLRSNARHLDLSAVSMEVAHLKPLVDALEKLQCRVQFIVPYSFLALEQAIADKSLPIPSASVWVTGQHNQTPSVEILVVDLDGAIRSWIVTGLEAESIEHHLSLLEPSPSNLCLLGTTDELEVLSVAIRRETRSIVVDCEALTHKRARAILAGREKPWIDLRRDALAKNDPWRRDRSAIATLAVAIVLFVVTVCGTLLWQAQSYYSVADSYKQKQQELFRVAFPSQRAPAAILARLKSEHTKAKGTRKTDPKATVPKSALVALHRIIDSLNEDFPFEVEEIRIENGRFAFQIELLSQQDAGRVATALAKKGFDVEPPATTLVHGDRVLASFEAIIDAEPLTKDLDGRSMP